jgi:hypothetical protein
MHMRRTFLWGLLSCLAACGDLQIRSIAPTQVVPLNLQGRWVGVWQSESEATTGNGGPVELRIQEFAGEPVVTVEMDNPCLVPRAYELVLTGDSIAMQADGQTVLLANQSEDRTLRGIYTCAEDHGSWTADWVADLPSLLDLSGTWEGRIYGGGQPEQAIALSLQQSIESGVLALRGVADLPGALPFALPLQGYVQFRDDQFDLVLQTAPGVDPQVVVSGIGDREPLQLPVGLVQVFSPTSLPFAQALIELVRQP